MFKTLLFTLTIILVSGTMFYYQIEGWSLFASFYFAFVSLIPTGVDTGLVPEATISKVFTMVYLIVGVGAMLLLLMKLGFALVKLDWPDEQEVKKKRRNFK
ncbi:ion channel [Planococcus sp. ISL-109]|uniref:ion channel n=1 Tax=Planococcus sp. ISL-109 TaxID=2819166 RepID=UPI002034FF6E|nr:ion channel [Planococcus sp. ISL-109]